jgi:hypothetical protein
MQPHRTGVERLETYPRSPARPSGAARSAVLVPPPYPGIKAVSAWDVGVDPTRMTKRYLSTYFHSCTRAGRARKLRCMDDSGRRGTRPAPGQASSPRVGDPAVRDANEILARALADEAMAAEARSRYMVTTMRPLAPDERVARHLRADEVVLAVRRSALIERREPTSDAQPRGPAGDLYLTSRRLMLLGRVSLSFELSALQEAALAGDRLLLVMTDGSAAALHVDRPRLLRVEIAAARAAVRA